MIELIGIFFNCSEKKSLYANSLTLLQCYRLVIYNFRQNVKVIMRSLRSKLLIRYNCGTMQLVTSESQRATNWFLLGRNNNFINASTCVIFALSANYYNCKSIACWNCCYSIGTMKYCMNNWYVRLN